MPERILFQAHGRRQVAAIFDASQNTSDGGALLLREVDQRFGILTQVAHCFRDRRDPRLTAFSVRDLVAQRVYALALGYEDINDHEQLRHDPLLALLVGREHLGGGDGEAPPLAGKSTLNRLELPVETVADRRYNKIAADPVACQKLFVQLFIQSRREVPRELVIDLDATDDPLILNAEEP